MDGTSRRFEDRVALVTGAGSGIGRATALELARLGARPILCDLTAEGLAETAADLGERCLLAERVDVSDREAMRSFAARVHAEVPAVDILVNNAGVAHTGGVLSTPVEDFDWVLGVNLGGVVHGCHFFVPAMVERGRGGHVVNVASALGYWGAPLMMPYCTSKSAVLGLSESLRSELAPEGIGVSAICPGVVATNIVSTARYAGVERLEETRGRVDALYRQRGYGPERVARSIVTAITRNRALAPVSPEAWALYWIKRFLPSLVGPLGRLVQRRMLGAETLPASG